jgi:hypothetical protein
MALIRRKHVCVKNTFETRNMMRRTIFPFSAKDVSDPNWACHVLRDTASALPLDLSPPTVEGLNHAKHPDTMITSALEAHSGTCLIFRLILRVALPQLREMNLLRRRDCGGLSRRRNERSITSWQHRPDGEPIIDTDTQSVFHRLFLTADRWTCQLYVDTATIY